ncbi:uroporphyrinogen-III synthase [Paraglaciecola aestuariivivens]
MFLLLRPQEKCASSNLAFQKQGLDSVACGLITTEIDQQQISSLATKIAALKAVQLQDIYVIVTSTVAAQQCILMHKDWPQNIKFFAVGASTAAILQQAGWPVVVPQEPKSEGLLALPELQQVANKTLVIVKGFGGRELLYQSLVARGAQVLEWEVYKRTKVSKPISTQNWQAEQIRCIIASSGEIIHAAFDFFEPTWLKTLDWIVVSERTASIATTLGVKHIWVSRDASDHALIQCAQQYLTGTTPFSEQ